ncbi:hypothetical protein [Gimesia sp.]|uniref:hypothetical protein n=1 Tax=Gimesia sp. TaxID=2024833 RepID=UPI000C456993|nr:hypothetical protein [Gimesia sp.]MAX39762.1 hypothetical protein [Gimesia sp.]HAH44664.1 hypothetical protein [Planctomycetaceae bacterium]|tara:strand:- start:30444 stop:30812 length:369 start_codon:yes stop_codon:yes gene_type:complete
MKQRLYQKFVKLFSRQNNVTDYLINQAGIVRKINDDIETQVFCWSEVTIIEVCKLDFFSYDEVALQFTTPEGCFEILEKHTAFEQLKIFLPEQYNVPLTWFSTVVENPFEYNYALLYQKNAE